jgi:hypothetical protein
MNKRPLFSRRHYRFFADRVYTGEIRGRMMVRILCRILAEDNTAFDEEKFFNYIENKRRKDGKKNIRNNSSIRKS